MSVLNPNGSSAPNNNWNYHKPDKEGYSLSIVGTVAAIQETQAMSFDASGQPTTPRFWEKSGKPVMNIRLVLVGASGKVRTWTIQPASKRAKEGKAKSVHLDLFDLAGGKDLLDLIGKTIKVTTIAPPEGFNYGRGNPRPWQVELVEDGPFEPAEPLDPSYLVPVVLANSAASGGQIQSDAGNTTSELTDDIPFF